MDQVVDTLRTYDTRWGYNGKRGNTNDPSKDVVAYHYGPDRTKVDGGLHYRHHRRPLRLDAVADLERRDRRHAQSGTIGSGPAAALLPPIRRSTDYEQSVDRKMPQSVDRKELWPNRWIATVHGRSVDR